MKGVITQDTEIVRKEEHMAAKALTKMNRVVRALRRRPMTIRALKSQIGFASETSVTGTISNLRSKYGYDIVGYVEKGRYKYALAA